MRTLVLARSTHGDGAEPSGIVEHYAVGERSLLRATMPPQELDEVERNLNIYFPLPLLPRTPSEDGKATVRALGQIPVEGKFRSTMDSSDDAITHTFELASPAKFSFNRKDALLDAFKEVHVIDKERGIVERFSTTSSIALGAGDDAVRVDIEVDIVATRAEKPAGVNGYILEKSLADLAAIEEGFRERKASSETAPRVDDLLKRTNETDFRALGHAAAAHLAAYRSVLETDGQGELLRRLLGKAPPDFELEGLDGKRVRLRDAIRGKVAYLNFWGVG